MTAESRSDRLHSAIKVQVAAGAIRGDWQCYAPDGRRRWLITAKLGEAFTGGWWQSERSLTTAEAEAFVNGVSAGLSAVSERVQALGDFTLSALLMETDEGSALAGQPPGCPMGIRDAARAEDLRCALLLLGLPSLGGDPFGGPE